MSLTFDRKAPMVWEQAQIHIVMGGAVFWIWCQFGISLQPHLECAVMLRFLGLNMMSGDPKPMPLLGGTHFIWGRLIISRSCGIENKFNVAVLGIGANYIV
jgi:hypothetical protein